MVTGDLKAHLSQGEAITAVQSILPDPVPDSLAALGNEKAVFLQFLVRLTEQAPDANVRGLWLPAVATT
jgi:hypothetical protein